MKFIQILLVVLVVLNQVYCTADYINHQTNHQQQNSIGAFKKLKGFYQYVQGNSQCTSEFKSVYEKKNTLNNKLACQQSEIEEVQSTFALQDDDCNVVAVNCYEQQQQKNNYFEFENAVETASCFCKDIINSVPLALLYIGISLLAFFGLYKLFQSESLRKYYFVYLFMFFNAMLLFAYGVTKYSFSDANVSVYNNDEFRFISSVGQLLTMVQVIYVFGLYLVYRNIKVNNYPFVCMFVAVLMYIFFLIFKGEDGNLHPDFGLFIHPFKSHKWVALILSFSLFIALYVLVRDNKQMYDVIIGNVSVQLFHTLGIFYLCQSPKQDKFQEINSMNICFVVLLLINLVLLIKRDFYYGSLATQRAMILVVGFLIFSLGFQQQL